MAGPAPIFREIHRLRRHARELQGEIDRLPRALEAQRVRLVRQEELQREAQEGLKHLKVATHEKEGTLRGRFQQIAKKEKQLDQAAGKKEYDALKAEIAAERKACAQLEDEILEGMGAVEEQTAALPGLEKAVAQARQELVQFESGAQARQAELAGELARTRESLRQVEDSLAADVRADYDRLTGARGEDGLSSVQGRTCTACYTEITHQNYNELLQGRFVVCKTCGRILYLPE